MALLILSRTTRVSWHQKGKTHNHEGKTNLNLLEQEIVSGSGLSWTICKSAPWPRHITTPASHHSAFSRCPSCRRINSVKALKALANTVKLFITDITCNVNDWILDGIFAYERQFIYRINLKKKLHFIHAVNGNRSKTAKIIKRQY